MKLRKLSREISHNVHLTRPLECRLLLDWLAINAQDSVCDIGCGDGFWSRQVAKRAGKVYSLDYASSACRQARSFYGDQVKIVKASGEHLPYKSNGFDKAISFSVWQLLPNDREALGDVYRVLKPGGIFGMSVDSLSLDSISEGYKDLQARRYGIQRYYTHAGLERLLAQTGFRMTHYRYVGVRPLSCWLIEKQVRLGWNVNYLAPFTIPLFNLLESKNSQAAQAGYFLVVAAEKKRDTNNHGPTLQPDSSIPKTD